jgi:hypothetical protein
MNKKEPGTNISFESCKLSLFIFSVLFSSFPICAQNKDVLSNDSRNTKVFSINNIPINICFLKNANGYNGFLIAGHAERAVCSAASLANIKHLAN